MLNSRPWHMHILRTIVYLEENLQDRDNEREREDIQQCRQQVKEHRQAKVLLVRRDEPPKDFQKFFHVILM